MSGASQATEVARDYYNSDDADRFYAQVWGGEDIHVGIYRTADEPIKTASRRTVDQMADKLTASEPARKVDAESVVLDIGSGYGGAARRLVERFGCRVVCVNLSETENERNRALNDRVGLANKIDVLDASFEQIPVDDGCIDVVWSQDAILHSGDRQAVLREVDRVLRSGGQFLFTDPMRSDDCPEGVLDPILARIHLADLGSPEFYRSLAAELGWRDLGFEPQTQQLVTHYTRVLEMTKSLSVELSREISRDYLDRMKAGLRHWIDGGTKGHLCWGIFHFQKPDKT